MSWYWWLLVCWAAFIVGFLLGGQWIMSSPRWHYDDRELSPDRHRDRERPEHEDEPGPTADPSSGPS